MRVSRHVLSHAGRPLPRRDARLACIARACFGLVVVLCFIPNNVSAYSSLAGSCEHGGVVHGMDRIEPQTGNGGYTLAVGNPGVNVGGATVPVVLSGDVPHKGFLIYAVDETKSTSKEFHLGSWDPSLMPDGSQQHPHCPYAATHDAFHNTGFVTDVLPWIVPVGLMQGSTVTFKVTVVRDYETWFAFTQSLTVGSQHGAGVEGFAFADTTDASATKTGAPGSKATTRAPGLGKAVEGGWVAPKTVGTKAPGEQTNEELKSEIVDKGKQRASGGKSLKLKKKVDLHDKHVIDPMRHAASHTDSPEDLGIAGGRKARGGAKGRNKKAKSDGNKEDKAPSDANVVPDPLAVDSVSVTKQKRRNARLAHGFAMAVAWLFFAPAGSLLARHGKASKTWFNAHRASGMIVAVITFLSAWYITSVRGFATPWGKHGKIGFVVCVLVLAQALGGTYRKKFPRTKWARWHRICGIFSIALGAYNCLAGASMVGWMESTYQGLLNYVRFGVVAWIVIACVMEVRHLRTGVARKRGRTA